MKRIGNKSLFRIMMVMVILAYAYALCVFQPVVSARVENTDDDVVAETIHVGRAEGVLFTFSVAIPVFFLILLPVLLRVAHTRHERARTGTLNVSPVGIPRAPPSFA